MTNTNHNHTAKYAVILDDVRVSTVVRVGKGAIEVLAGPAEIVDMKSSTRGDKRLVEFTIEYYAANWNEADRTAEVFRSAILPIVYGATTVGTWPM